MTEAEAKTKWCPFTRCEGSYAYGNPAHNRYMKTHGADDDDPIGETRSTVALPAASLCIASACMAWRQLPGPDLREAREFAANGQKINALQALRVPYPGLNLKEAKDIVEGVEPWPTGSSGYCGLAGAPQS